VILRQAARKRSLPERSDMAFVQIIEFRSNNIDEMPRLRKMRAWCRKNLAVVH
jgi:hypothetical protein